MAERLNAPVLKTDGQNSEATNAQEITHSARSVLPDCLPESLENDPALKRLVEAWPTLPEHLRATIRMLVESVASTTGRTWCCGNDTEGGVLTLDVDDSGF